MKSRPTPSVVRLTPRGPRVEPGMPFQTTGATRGVSRKRSVTTKTGPALTKGHFQQTLEPPHAKRPPSGPGRGWGESGPRRNLRQRGPRAPRPHRAPPGPAHRNTRLPRPQARSAVQGQPRPRETPQADPSADETAVRYAPRRRSRALTARPTRVRLRQTRPRHWRAYLREALEARGAVVSSRRRQPRLRTAEPASGAARHSWSEAHPASLARARTPPAHAGPAPPAHL